MPDPDDELLSMYGSEYGRQKPTVPKPRNKQRGKAKKIPEPDQELESLADFASSVYQESNIHF